MSAGRSIAVAAALLLGACAAYKVDMPAEMAAYGDLKPTTASYAEMSFVPLSLPMKQDVEIGRGDGVFNFEEGPSYYKAYALPVSDKPYVVAVGSYAMENSCATCRGSAYFYQKLLMLDADKKPLNQIFVRGPDYVPLPGGTYKRSVGFDQPTNGIPRYMIVYTTHELIDKGETHTTPGGAGMVMAGAVMIPIIIPSRNAASPGSPAGHLSIELKIDE